MNRQCPRSPTQARPIPKGARAWRGRRAPQAGRAGFGRMRGGQDRCGLPIPRGARSHRGRSVPGGLRARRGRLIPGGVLDRGDGRPLPLMRRVVVVRVASGVKDCCLWGLGRNASGSARRSQSERARFVTWGWGEGSLRVGVSVKKLGQGIADSARTSQNKTNQSKEIVRGGPCLWMRFAHAARLP